MAALVAEKPAGASLSAENYSEIYRLLSSARRRRVLVLYLAWARKGAPQATPKMIADELRDNLPLIARDIRRLAGVGLLTLKDIERGRRGAAHWYAASAGASSFAPLLAEEIRAASEVGQ